MIDHAITTLSLALSLHTPTLLVATALMVAFSGCLLVLAPGSKDDTKAMRVWGAAMLVGATSLALVAFGQGSPWVWEGLGITMALAAAATSWTAARIFVGRLPRLWQAAAGPALWVATMPFQAGAPLWAAMACLAGAAYTLATAAELWQARTQYLPSRIAAVSVLVVHGAIYAACAVGVLLGEDAGSWAASIINGMILESMLHTVGMGFLLIAMMKERVELRSVEQLRDLALRDGLTGISNRRHFDEQLELEVGRARRVKASLALLLIDVDHFKAFNDAFGHQQGDRCLRKIAGTLAALVCRPGDLVARYGGEEFTVLLPETDLAGAVKFADALRVAVRALELKHTSEFGIVTISIGAAAIRPRQQQGTGEVLVHAADQALYQAKAAGRDKVCSSLGAIFANR